MCMFIAPADVHITHQYAALTGTRQLLLYELEVSTKVANAMILPVPVAQGGGSIQPVDMSSRARFFEELFHHYVEPEPMPCFAPGASAPRLEVMRVGSYEASIVPTAADIARLDDRFRLQPSLIAGITSRYADHAFVVYQFAPGLQHSHPFGFTWETRYRGQLFFPTVHIHDGASFDPVAKFAHKFYAQRAWLDSRHRPLGGAAGMHVPGIVDPRLPLDYGARWGDFDNVDVFASVEA